MSANTITLRGRTKAEQLMVDNCVITRPDPVATIVDPETGNVTPVYTTVYTGKCRLKLPTAVTRPLIVGEAQEFLQHPILSLPVATTGVAINDIVTITASALMPQLVGRVFHVRGRPGQSHMTAARFEVMEVSG